MRIIMIVLALLQLVVAVFVAGVGGFADGGTWWERATLMAVQPIAAIGLVVLVVHIPPSRLLYPTDSGPVGNKRRRRHHRGGGHRSGYFQGRLVVLPRLLGHSGNRAALRLFAEQPEKVSVAPTPLAKSGDAPRTRGAVPEANTVPFRHCWDLNSIKQSRLFNFRNWTVELAVAFQRAALERFLLRRIGTYSPNQLIKQRFAQLVSLFVAVLAYNRKIAFFVVVMIPVNMMGLGANV